MTLAEESEQSNALELATELAIAWLSNPNTNASADEVPVFLQKVYGALNSLGSESAGGQAPSEPEYTPAVSVRKSLASKDHIISMIDGKPYKTLRRHLTGHGLTAEQYRDRYNLKADYPMVSESYSEVRRDMAKKIGLGRKPGQKVGARKKAASASPRGQSKSKAGELTRRRCASVENFSGGGQCSNVGSSLARAIEVREAAIRRGWKGQGQVYAGVFHQAASLKKEVLDQLGSWASWSGHALTMLRSLAKSTCSFR